MSDSDERLPSTIAWGLVAAALVGTVALSVVDLATVLGACCGLVLAGTVPGFEGTKRRVAGTAALVPIVVVATFAVVGTTGSVFSGTLAIAGIVAGVATGSVHAGRVTRTAISRAGTATLFAGLTAGVVAFGSVIVVELGGLGPTVRQSLWLSGYGVLGLLLPIGSVAAAWIFALVCLPSGAIVPPTRREAYRRTRNGLIWGLVIGVVVIALGLWAVAVLSWFLSPLEGIVSAVVESPWLRALSVVLAALGLVTAIAGLIVRYTWFETEGRENPAVAILAGAVVGTVVPFPIALLVSGEPLGTINALYGVVSVVLVGGWLLTALTERGVGVEMSTASAIALALGVGGVVAATNVEGPVSLETAPTAIAALVTIAAGLFAFDVGRYGRRLTTEIGTEGAASEPQFVRLGWSAMVAGVGVPVAIGGLALATALAPTLSVPATAAVVAALVAIVTGAKLLID
ncbi:hypothetical protein [Halopiger goleimassiliensis]|uniref:hypothetical protein n=1 Tax=Halopiger goleimassiliensis TaxID=1293048 RepID=UPI00067759A4|nr:hypothetical protein [Halopiger goleimassiliensis]